MGETGRNRSGTVQKRGNDEEREKGCYYYYYYYFLFFKSSIFPAFFQCEKKQLKFKKVGPEHTNNEDEGSCNTTELF